MDIVSIVIKNMLRSSFCLENFSCLLQLLLRNKKVTPGSTAPVPRRALQWTHPVRLGQRPEVRGIFVYVSWGIVQIHTGIYRQECQHKYEKTGHLRQYDLTAKHGLRTCDLTKKNGEHHGFDHQTLDWCRHGARPRLQGKMMTHLWIGLFVSDPKIGEQWLRYGWTSLQDMD